MKKLISILIAVLTLFTAKAQLANTSWKTTLNLDQTVNTIFIFTSDTLTVKNIDDNSNLETMKYKFHDSTLNIQKLFGQSECDTTAIGSYSCKINGNDMTIKLISDDCNQRAEIIKDVKLQKTDQ